MLEVDEGLGDRPTLPAVLGELTDRLLEHARAVRRLGLQRSPHLLDRALGLEVVLHVLRVDGGERVGELARLRLELRVRLRVGVDGGRLGERELAFDLLEVELEVQALALVRRFDLLLSRAHEGCSSGWC